MREGPLDELSTFDDPRPENLKISVQLIGADGQNTPPAHALAARGIVTNISGFTVYGDYTSPAPQSPIVDAVAHGDVDVALVWRPSAGYFAGHEPVKLKLTLIPLADGPALPTIFDISMGFRRRDVALSLDLDGALTVRAAEIKAVLVAYRVPLIDAP